MSLQNKVVVVTGGARGMGRALVKAFLAQGAKVAAVDVSWKPTGLAHDTNDAFARELDSRTDALKLTCDITQQTQVDAALAATLAKFGTVDVLINNAALLPHTQFPPTGEARVLEISDADWQRGFDVNLFGTLRMIRAFIKPMIKQRSGSIISVGSGGSVTRADPDGFSWGLRRPFSREQPYMATKAAVVAMSCFLADEVKEHNIAVNVLHPTGTRGTGHDEKVQAWKEQNRPAPEFVAPPEHVVPLALFLAEQNPVTGVTGRAIETIPWNEKHGHGGWEKWNDVHND